MNNLIRAAFNASKYRALFTPLKSAVKTNVVQNLQVRNLAIMGANPLQNSSLMSTVKEQCICGCGARRHAHSKAERELVEFLTEEILTERKAQKSKTLPTQIDGYKIQLDGAEVTFLKEVGNEKITITFNVNHTVDSDVEPEINSNADKPELGELKSRPTFRVEILRGQTTLNLLCSFISSAEQDEGYNDIFGVDELSIYDGEWNENIYSVSGEVLDSYLYDLILNYLDEKGISNEFVEKLSDFSTSYEHSAYIGLLEGLSKFASGK